jgi:hypothetical protein
MVVEKRRWNHERVWRQTTKGFEYILGLGGDRMSRFLSFLMFFKCEKEDIRIINSDRNSVIP